MRGLIAAMAALAILAGGIACTEETTSQDAGRADDAPAQADSPAPEESAEPEPNAKYDSVCDYLLGDFTESSSGYRFVADTTIRNTGNVGVVVRATAIWDQIGGDPVKQTKRAKVATGKSRKVSFEVIASQDQIDRHQSAASGCRVRVNIVDTFGAPEG